MEDGGSDNNKKNNYYDDNDKLISSQISLNNVDSLRIVKARSPNNNTPNFIKNKINSFEDFSQRPESLGTPKIPVKLFSGELNNKNSSFKAFEEIHLINKPTTPLDQKKDFFAINNIPSNISVNKDNINQGSTKGIQVSRENLEVLPPSYQSERIQKVSK